jgi:hypothetical protein
MRGVANQNVGRFPLIVVRSQKENPNVARRQGELPSGLHGHVLPWGPIQFAPISCALMARKAGS